MVYDIDEQQSEYIKELEDETEALWEQMKLAHEYCHQHENGNVVWSRCPKGHYFKRSNEGPGGRRVTVNYPVDAKDIFVPGLHVED